MECFVVKKSSRYNCQNYTAIDLPREKQEIAFKLLQILEEIQKVLQGPNHNAIKNFIESLFLLFSHLINGQSNNNIFLKLK
jgi:hypothetical protein